MHFSLSWAANVASLKLFPEGRETTLMMPHLLPMLMMPHLLPMLMHSNGLCSMCSLKKLEHIIDEQVRSFNKVKT